MPQDDATHKGTFYRSFGKRAFDITFTLIVLPLIAPIILVLALLVRRDGGPAFFSHQRIGRNGVPFGCLKLRTMVPDAKQRLEDYLSDNPEERENWNANFKLENDPRVTKLGHFLRKTSFDELPQFFNVLRGDLSVVGPRPVTSDEIGLYGPSSKTVLSIAPGITGVWQTSGRNDVSYDTRVAMDLEYAENFTFASDLKLVCKTVEVVVKPTGI